MTFFSFFKNEKLNINSFVIFCEFVGFGESKRPSYIAYFFPKSSDTYQLNGNIFSN